MFYYGPRPGLFAFEQPATSLDHAASLSKTSNYWYIYGGNDYAGFDFDRVPVPWEVHQLHVWPSQWQRTGGVYLANRLTVANREYNFHTDHVFQRQPNRDLWQIPSNIDDTDFDYSWHPDETESDYEYHFGTQWQRDGGPVYPGGAGIKYMGNQRIRANATQIFYMDFLNPHSLQQFETLRQKWPNIRNTRYVDSHLNVFRRIMNLATTEYVWIISSVCDYGNFDFTWHPEPEQREMIHCFPSGNQVRGDTFYIHVPSFTQQMIELEILDWFSVINYCDDQTVFRFETPVHRYNTDNLVQEIQNYNFQTPYVLFTNQLDLHTGETPCLWTHKDRVVLRCSASGATAIVPRDIKADLKTQIYDYPYIETSKHMINDAYRGQQWLDIVYISNGEPDEERWYEHACDMSKRPVKWIRGINGRTAAYQAAARASDTPWFFAVFAKLEVLGSEFDWFWMPDYFQEPKHYIFNARNPVNGLEYGHQGMIAYNKRLVLENNSPGIDFTLSQPHESVPMLSGTAHFNQDAWMTWRTAFREVIKLRYFQQHKYTLETEHRLQTWCTRAEGDHAEWCLRGAQDALAYYEQVYGDYQKLKLSFDWAWLRERFTANTR